MMTTMRSMLCMRPMLWLLVLLPVSCSNDSNSGRPTERKSLSQRIDEKNGYSQDASGNWVPQTNKRSSFEGQGQSPYAKGEVGKKAYKTGEYDRKSWWGNKQYGRQQYAGNTDGSRFQKDSRFDGKGARESGNAADIPDPYQTDNYATKTARESGESSIDRPSDAETDIRRRVYQPPEIIDWREQRTLSLEQSKGILGR